MEDNIKMTLLYDIYGSLLTKKQKEIFEQYYIYNLSLREIAQNINISYQAVRDSINSSKKMLQNFDNNIGMYNLKKNIHDVLEIIKRSDDLNLKKQEIINLLESKSEDDI